MKALSPVCAGYLLKIWVGYTAVVVAISFALQSLGLPEWAGWAAAGILAVAAVERTLS